MKVYSAPESIKIPEIDYRNIEKSVEEEKRFVEELEAWCKENGDGKYTGKIVRFPHADGYAQYMVVERGRSTSLIHLPLGDAWHLPEPYTRGLRKADIVQNIQSQERMAKLFSPKS